MVITINRPVKAAVSSGLLGYELFQTAYVTNNLDRAKEVFGSAYNIRNWTEIDAGAMKIALAWISGHQVEVIQTMSDHQPLYDDLIDKDGEFVVRHHHFGYFIHDDDEWAQLRRHLDASGRPLLLDVDTGSLKAIYIAAPDLGHHLEYIFPNEAGKAFFEGVATN